MVPLIQGGSNFDPAAIERVEWLVQRELGASVPEREPRGAAAAGPDPGSGSAESSDGGSGSAESPDDGSESGGWTRFLRDGHPPRFPAPRGVEVTAVDAAGSESFGSTAAFGLGLPARTESTFAALPGRPGWRCYVALGGKAPAAAATFVDGSIVLLAIDATREAGRRSPARTALLHRAIDDAVEAGARTIGARIDTAADAPRKETAAGLLLAGFKAAYRCPPWVDAGLPAS
jgi:hypothetical protein